MNLHFNDLEYLPLTALTGSAREVGQLFVTVALREGKTRAGVFTSTHNPDGLKLIDRGFIVLGGDPSGTPKVEIELDQIATITVS